MRLHNYKDNNYMQTNDEARFRLGVGIMIINNEKKILVGKRSDTVSNRWQMPQGGIEEGEDEVPAMYRELHEETGIIKNAVTMLAQSNYHLKYLLPQNLAHKVWNGQYIGQKQRWFLLNFHGSDDDIKVGIPPHDEFKEFTWVNKDQLLEYIVEFKRPLYEEVVQEFAEFL